MGFGRRKSSNNVDEAQVGVYDEAEARRRNRLSKPLTNKSSTNLLLLVPDQESKSNNASAEALGTSCLLELADEDRRQQIRAHVFDIDKDNAPLPVAAKHSSLNGVASLVSKFENQTVNNSSQQSLLSPTKPRRPFSDLFSSRRPSAQSRPSLTSSNSKDRLAVLKDKSNTPSPAVSTEQIVDSPSIPTSRKASYIPGTATRKSSGYISDAEDIPKIATSPMEEPNLDRDDLSDVLSFDEGDDEDWLPPPQNPRPVTPASLDYTHLGGLRLGSLQVVNGRASPAASEMSKHLVKARMAVLRDTSSDYGDADTEIVQRRKQSSETNRTTLIHSREMSWYSRRSSNLHKVESVEVRSVSIASIEPTDLASAMAAEYMAELETNPYEVRKQSSESTLHQRFAELPASPMTIKPKASDKFLQHSIQIQKRSSPEALQRTLSVYDNQSIHSMEADLGRSSSPVPSEQSSTGSVLRTTTKRTEMDDNLFDDEAIGPSPEPDRETINSFYSWQSPVNLDHQRNEAFESAVEFQVPPSPQRIESRETLEPPKRFEKSDSGYSSNNSVRSSSGERAVDTNKPLPVAMPSTEHIAPTPFAQVAEPRGTASKFFRPILKSRKTVPLVPVFENLQPTPAASILSKSTATSIADTDKPKRKKLQKKGFLKQKKPIMVTNVKSIDDLTIPPVPPASSANLQIRSQEVPELQRTFRTERHVKNQASTSTMNLPLQEIRFPSPSPPLLEPPEKQVKTRRRSWLGLLKEKEAKPKPRPQPQLSEHDARTVINDFGTVTSSLGGNPYDIAQAANRSREPSRTSINPHNISSREPRARSFMDDQTAAELARLRSSSIRERDDWQLNSSRKSSFNDRGGIPGKNLRPASIARDAPPLPPLPTKQTWQNHWTPEEEDDIAPPPPPHSPRPSFVEAAGAFENTSSSPPPPPPSHSPRPVEITHDPWAAQQAAWQSRRQTASEAWKRQSWQADGYDQEAAEEEEPLYPSLPPRRNDTIQRRAQNYTQTRHYSFQPGVSAHDYDFHVNNNTNSSPYDRDYMQPYTHHPSAYLAQQSYQYQFHTQPYDHNDPEQNAPRALPQLSSSRPASRAGSHRSFASSMAEELHPELDESRPAGPKNDFGRYSGGLQYGFEKSNGFGGSAGTRTVSGKAAGGYKGMALREDFGVDLGDVPVMGVIHKVDSKPPVLPMVNFR